MDKPDFVRRLNYLGESIGGPLYILRLEPDEMIAIAKQTTGLSDFGHEDWVPFYRRAVLFLDKSDLLHLTGRIILKTQIMRSLRNRLLLVERLKNNPSISRQAVSAPIFIIGNPRTGTTLLFELLALDDRLRVPLSWQAASPVEHSDIALPGQRIGESVNDLMMDIQPGMKPMHELRWDLPAECQQIMEINCMPRFVAHDENSRIVESLRHANDYTWHKRVLQVLQYGKPARTWLLKCPSHINFLEEILSVYPDARFIFTHRDPAKYVPSILTLIQYHNSIYTDTAVNTPPGAIVKYLADGVHHAMRRAPGVMVQDRFIDIYFRDLVKDPLSEISGIYTKFGMELREDHAHRISNYLKQNPKYKNGKYQIRAEDHGLKSEDIRATFQTYMDAYRIPIEE